MAHRARHWLRYEESKPDRRRFRRPRNGLWRAWPLPARASRDESLRDEIINDPDTPTGG